MGFRDLFKKNKTGTSPSEQAEKLGGVHQIINILWGEDGVNHVVSECKGIIDFLLHEEDVERKTDLLFGGIDITLEQMERLSKKPDISVGSRNITAFIYYRFFFECVLAIDNDIMDISHLYSIFQITKHIPENAHPYIQTMIKIYDLIDRGIIYLYENMDAISKDYFSIIASKIQTMLDDYEDDSTDWNKINN